jgi:hypothetical protein
VTLRSKVLGILHGTLLPTRSSRPSTDHSPLLPASTLDGSVTTGFVTSNPMGCIATSSYRLGDSTFSRYTVPGRLDGGWSTHLTAAPHYKGCKGFKGSALSAVAHLTHLEIDPCAEACLPQSLWVP